MNRQRLVRLLGILLACCVLSAPLGHALDSAGLKEPVVLLTRAARQTAHVPRRLRVATFAEPPRRAVGRHPAWTRTARRLSFAGLYLRHCVLLR